MKNFLFVFLLVAGTVRLCAQAPVATAGSNPPIITFDSDKIDFGSVTQYSDQVRVFTFTNTGSSPLTITNIKGQCGCTTASDWPKDPIPPGGKGTFKVKYDTSIRVGMFDKQIMIYSNAATPVMTVTIKGNVVPAGTSTGGN
jgi:hypothetical protein